MSVMKISNEGWLRLPPELREQFSGRTIRVEVEQLGEGAAILRIVRDEEEATDELPVFDFGDEDDSHVPRLHAIDEEKL